MDGFGWRRNAPPPKTIHRSGTQPDWAMWADWEMIAK
jgi:hypothetical protein